MGRPREIPRRLERLRINHLLLDLARTFHNKSYRGPGGRRFGSEIDVVFVGLAVAIGDLENRPMSTSDIATYIEMPRATVQRKLSELIKRDLVTRERNKYRMSPFAIEGGDALVKRAHRAIEKALGN